MGISLGVGGVYDAITDRARTDGRAVAVKRFEVVENATALIWKTLLVVEQHFRRPDATHLCTAIHDGAIYQVELRVSTSEADDLSS